MQIISENRMQVKCPQCPDVFEVDKSMLNNHVNCEHCNHTFTIEEKHINLQLNYFPGERKSSQLQFRKMQGDEDSLSVQYQTEAYIHESDLQQYKWWAYTVGIGGWIAGALLLILNVWQGSILSDIDEWIRYSLAAALWFVMSLLWWQAFPKKVIQIVALSAFIASLYLGLFYWNHYFLKPSLVQKKNSENALPVALSPEFYTVPNLEYRLGLKPLLEERAKNENRNDGIQAYAIYFTNMEMAQRTMIRDFIIRKTEADFSSHIYPRTNGEFLLVLKEVKGTYDLILALASMLGQVQAEHPSLGLVEVKLNREIFVQPPYDLLINPEAKEFYLLNLQELRAIDENRVSQALTRLAKAAPKMYRDDISNALLNLLKQDQGELLDELSSAILTWIDDLSKVQKIALLVLQRLEKRLTLIPDTFIELLVRSESYDAIPSIVNYWIKNPVKWEKSLMSMGSHSEQEVLLSLNNVECPLRSAIQILNKVGTAKSIEPLQALHAKQNQEIQYLIDAAISSIQSRLKNGS